MRTLDWSVETLDQCVNAPQFCIHFNKTSLNEEYQSHNIYHDT